MQLNRTYDAHMFYFFFESRSLKADDPVVLWMTGKCGSCVSLDAVEGGAEHSSSFIGGPGCSSELAVFYENGPYHIKEDLSLERSEYGWDTNSNMIFVDQPINTGFSYSDVSVCSPDHSLCYSASQAGLHCFYVMQHCSIHVIL